MGAIYGPQHARTTWLLGYESISDRPSHNHVASVDERGNGKTSRDHDHFHAIIEGVITSAKGHTHERVSYEAPGGAASPEPTRFAS